MPRPTAIPFARRSVNRYTRSEALTWRKRGLSRRESGPMAGCRTVCQRISFRIGRLAGHIPTLQTTSQPGASRCFSTLHWDKIVYSALMETLGGDPVLNALDFSVMLVLTAIIDPVGTMRESSVGADPSIV